MTDEIAIMGTIGVMASNGQRVRLSVNKVSESIGASTINSGVNRIDNENVQAIETMRIFFIFLSSPWAFASATNFEMAMGRPSCVILMTRNKVGNAIIY